MRELAANQKLSPCLREKLTSFDELALADFVLNTILRNTGIHLVIPAMMRVEHIRTNVRAIGESRFLDDEIAEIRDALIHCKEPGCLA
jgi:aryl-alcohol dehydrogenase-like predicted oxidoreductase